MTTKPPKSTRGLDISSDRELNPLKGTDQFSVLEYDAAIGTIPAGARDIKIEEVTASENSLCKYKHVSKRFNSFLFYTSFWQKKVPLLFTFFEKNYSFHFPSLV